MTRRVKAITKGKILAWARETAGFSSISEAAVKLDITEVKLAAWESEVDAPSIPQLRKLADLYKRPLAVFYLQEVPTTFQVIRDLRRLPGTGFRRLPPNLVYEWRRASEQRALALDLMEDIGDLPTRFSLQAEPSEDPEDVGLRIRAALGVTMEQQRRWRDTDGRTSLRAWRDRIEAAGVLVFQATRFSSEEASGFAIAAEVLPVVVVNRKDTPTRRTFSLVHELTHLMLRVSGVSDLDTDARRPPEDQAIEIFCNHVAAAALMPQDSILTDPRVRQHGSRAVDWSDSEITDLARLFGVSREALLRRLLAFGLTTDAFYRNKRVQYRSERQAQIDRERALQGDEGRPRNMPLETVSNFGRPLVQMILGNYYQDRLSLSEVAGYLGIKTKHIPKLEQVVGLR